MKIIEIEQAIIQLETLKRSNPNFEKPLKYAIELMEHEIPKRPIVTYENYGTDADGNRGMLIKWVECPCGAILDSDEDRCPDCQQLIDWEREE